MSVDDLTRQHRLTVRSDEAARGDQVDYTRPAPVLVRSSGVNDLEVVEKDQQAAEDSSATARSNSPPRSDRRPETETESSPSLLDTPSSRRKNKRKMTSPRRRPNTDFSIRSLCSSSNSDRGDVDGEDDDDAEERTTGSTDAKIFRAEDVSGLTYGGTAANEELFIRAKNEFIAAAAAAAARSSTAAASSREFSFYPLNIPTVYRRIPTPLFVSGSTASALPATSRVVRPPSVDSLNSSGGSGDQDRLLSAGPQRSEAVVAGTSFDRSSDDSPPSATSVAAAGNASTGGRSSSAASRRGGGGGGRAGSPRKNYKNMTKQRRIEANARERSRVHLISAAFESLRRAVPSYSYNQRLSKLAILRIACSYILALARLADLDYSGAADDDGSGTGSSGGNTLSFADCVDLCTQTIQAEGKAKRRH